MIRVGQGDWISMENDQEKRFAESLNRHGYPFQNAVIKVAHEEYDGQRSRWIFEAAEFPVELDKGTKIDFILRIQESPWWMVAECKRVNPAFSDWFFVRSPYIRRGRDDGFFVDVVRKEPGEFTAVGHQVFAHALNTGPFYHIGVDVKTNNSGDTHGGTGQAIEDAASQVCRGVGGLIQYLYKNTGALGPARNGGVPTRALIPVIFTTAKLFVSEVDLAETDLQTGKIDPKRLQPEPKPFIYYQYHLSPATKHRIPGDPYTELASVLAADFIRTIPIVSAEHVAEFLRIFDPANFYPEKIKGI
jgi:hypothetical protein